MPSSNNSNKGKGKVDNTPVSGTDQDDDLDALEGSNKINGGDGDDVINGGDGYDFINAGDGDDVVTGGAGDDLMHGNDGFDTAVFSGSVFDYSFTSGKGNATIATGADGEDTLKHFEALKFDDFTNYIDGRNNAPFTRADSGETNEDNVVLVESLLDNDMDIDGDEFSITSIAASDSGALVTLVDAQGSVKYDPNGSFESLAVGTSSDDTFSYTVTDSNGDTRSETVAVTVTGVNDAPTLSSSSANANEDGASVSLDLSALGADVDSDNDGSDLSYSLLNVAVAGSASINGTDLSFDPGNDFQSLAVDETTTFDLDVQAEDAHGATATNTLAVTVTGANDAPTLAGSSASASEDGASVSVDLSALGADVDSDNDGSNLNYSLVNPAAGGSASINGSDLSFDPGSDFQSLAFGETTSVDLEVQAADGHGATATNTIAVTVSGVNDAPVAGDDSVSTDEDTPLTISAVNLLDNDTDIDNGDTKVLTSVENAVNGNVSIHGGNVVFTPDANFSGEASFDYTMEDGRGETSTATVGVTVNAVNDAPAIDVMVPSVELISNGSFEVGPSSGSVPLGGSTAISDWLVTGDSVDYLSSWQASDGSTSLDLSGNDAGGVEQTISTAIGAEYTLRFDMAGNTHSNAVKDMTVSAGDTTQDFSFDNTGNSGTDMGWTEKGFTFIATSTETVVSFSSLEAGADGPALDNVSVVRNGDGFFVNGETTLAITGISISDVDAAGDEVELTLQVSNGTLTVAAGVAGGLSSGGIVGNGTGTTILTGTLAAINATLADASGLVYQGTTGFSGDDTLNITTDDLGNNGSGGALTDIAAVSITVDSANTAPDVVAIDAGSIGEDDSPVTIDLLAGQTDADGDTLSAQDIEVTDDLSNSVTFTDNGNGSITIDPNQYDALDAGEDRTLTVNYKVSDGRSGSANSATLVVEGAFDNKPPVAADDALGATGPGYNENSTYTIAAADILGNDTDPNSDTLRISAVSATSSLGSTVILYNDGSVGYNPTTSSTLDELAEGETTEDSFTYTVIDPQGATDTATVTMTVSGVDDPPVLTNTVSAQSGFTDADFSYELPSDLFTDHDEGTDISYSVTLSNDDALPSWLSFDASTLTLSFAADAPSASDVGLYSLKITATEEDGQSSSEDLTLTLLDGELIEGTTGNDSLTGTIQGDLITGLPGNDTLTGLPGSDVLDGGEGNDTLRGEAGNDVLIGGEGYDYLYGGDGDDILNGGNGGGYLNGDDGSDTVTGGDGNDVFNGDYDQNSDDIMIGGAGNDTFNTAGYYSNDVIDAGPGDDSIRLYANGNSNNPGIVNITLGSGADVIDIYATGGGEFAHGRVTDFNVSEDKININYILDNRLQGWDGSVNPFDTSVGFMQLAQDGANTLLQIDFNGGGDGYRTFLVLENTQASNFTAENFNPPYPADGSVPAGITVTGTDNGERLDGTIGTDTLIGLGGNDRLYGGASGDLLQGGDGRDSLYGEAGDDILEGGNDYDNLYGGDGNDILNGGDGGGYLNGDDGSDIVTGGDGNDYFNGDYDQNSDDVMIGGAGNDSFNTAGYYSNDVIDAGPGDDFIRLYANGHGNNPGIANITLGSGADVIDIYATGGGDFAHGRVTDFDVSEDKINIDYILDNRLSGWDGSVNPFDASAGFMRLTQDGANTLLEIDFNGGGDNYRTFLVMENTLASNFAASNFDPPYPPDGSVPAGITVTGTANSERLDGTIGTDTLIGLGGNDQLYGGPSADLLEGGEGNDNLRGEAGNDTLNGGNGFDYLYGGDGDDILNGGDGGGFLNGDDGSDIVTGGDGNDSFNGDYDQNSDDIMIGGAGNDSFNTAGYYSNDVIDAGPGDDSIRLYANGHASNPGIVNVALGSGADVIDVYATAGGDYAHAIVSDFNVAEDFFNLEYTLNSRLSGWDGSSNPFAAGYMKLIQDGTDTLLQIDRNGGGDSYLTVVRMENTTASSFAEANFQVNATSGQGYNSDGSGVFGSTFNGSAAGETISGTYGDDLINGFAGNDTLLGANGNDIIDGGADGDTINGGFGSDLLTGGSGNDLFVFKTGDGVDVINDFVAGAGTDDVIDFANLNIFSGLADVQNAASQVGSDAVLDLGNGDSITLVGVNVSNLHADDFQF